MFDFKIFKNGLTDSTLSKNEFRILCLMLNQSSFLKSKTFEMYNGYIQDTLGISERNVRDATKSLVEKGYIKKEVSANLYNRNANTYTIIDGKDENKNGDNDSDKNDEKDKDLGAEGCTEKCAENCPPNETVLNENNQVLNNDKSSSDKVIEEVKYLDGDSVNSSERNSDEGDSVNDETKQQNKMNEMSDNGAIGVKSTYGSTTVEDIKCLKECRPAPAPKRRREDDFAFNKKVDEWKDFLIHGTKCLSDFDKGFKGLAIAADNVVKSNGWTEKAQNRWFRNMNSWWDSSKHKIYGNYMRNIDHERNKYKGTINPKDRFDEVCAPFECKVKQYAITV